MSIRRQCALLQVNRSNYYYQSEPVVSINDIRLMNKIDKIWTKSPFYGVPRITAQLRREGLIVNHKRVYRLMKMMGIEAIFPRKNLSRPERGHEVYPYLLKNLVIKRVNQVWGVDITYIRLQDSFLYLFAVLDWFSRYILAWQLSDSLATEFCCQALEEALSLSIPEIHNSDQGSQLTANKYLAILKAHPEIKISMDGRGRAFDNIFTERLWRTIKYEEVYLKDYQSPKEARKSIAKYVDFYNNERLHQSLSYKTPSEVYFKN